MTVKKATEILEWMLNNKTKTVKEFYEPEILNAKYDTSEKLYRTLKLIEETDIHNLQAIKEQLVSKCKHPKKMRDLDPETKKPYCMACNLDL